jgi:cell wall assembly regulator SMI1
MICLDLAPGESGVVGQLIHHEARDDGPLVTRFNSFATWLQQYALHLQSGQYLVDEHGFLEKR